MIVKTEKKDRNTGLSFAINIEAADLEDTIAPSVHVQLTRHEVSCLLSDLADIGPARRNSTTDRFEMLLKKVMEK